MITVDHEQTRSGECLHDLARTGVADLVVRGPAANIVTVVSKFHHPQQHVPGDGTVGTVESVVGAFSRGGDRGAHATRRRDIRQS